jgi:hypothetical protein
MIDPDTGKPTDDLVPLIDSIEFLKSEDKTKIFNVNAINTFPLLKAI